MYEAELPLPAQPAAKRPRGFALRNIHRRLRILYGEPYGLGIDKTHGSGTAFVVRIPFQWNEEEEEEAV
ncbi:sensor histidine kinase [Cohnella sp. GCM10020058]|uniref:sensor histidine kinase n=1 Tax=Cohnella sp. GCM10020058 TaxID=3317330 RepID=UPI003642EA10